MDIKTHRNYSSLASLGAAHWILAGVGCGFKKNCSEKIVCSVGKKYFLNEMTEYDRIALFIPNQYQCDI